MNADERKLALSAARDVLADSRIDEEPTREALIAMGLVWYADMLERARRVCTAARRHVDWSRLHAAQRTPSPGVAPTMVELQTAVDALVAQGEGERG